MTISKAANELDAIRSNRTDDTQTLIRRVDRIGNWLATQRAAKAQKLLSECHHLHDKLNGGSGKGGIRLEM